MLRGSVLLAALLFSAPTLWQAFVQQDISVDTAIVRFLVALPVSAVLIGAVRLATRQRR
jgi:hypothetical protein